MKQKLINSFNKIIKDNRIQLIIAAVGILFIVIYKLLTVVPGGEIYFYNHITRPVHSFLATINDYVNFSVIELLIAVLVLACLVFLVWKVVYIIRKGSIYPFFSICITAAMLFCIIYGIFCLAWGVYYEASDISQICNMDVDGVEHQDLIAVDEYFVGIANEYSKLVNRNDAGIYTYQEDEIFDHSLVLYDQVVNKFPGLTARSHIPKKVLCSKVMSYIDFTGFFSPFTAEANINVDSPECMIPATIAHELAHQRGVAQEDAANFVAILACMEDGDVDYVYSASLLALIHLQNALFKSGDMDNWRRIRDTYSDEVVADIQDNSRYWEKYRKSVSYKVSSGTYDGFLKSYGQELGRETYGACVDFLVEYYR